jgi:hypothetical protein
MDALSAARAVGEGAWTRRLGASHWWPVEARASRGQYSVTMGVVQLTAQVPEAGTWLNYMRCRVGHVHVGRPGEHTIKVKPLRIQGDALMNLRTLSFHTPPALCL